MDEPLMLMRYSVRGGAKASSRCDFRPAQKNPENKNGEKLFNGLTPQFSSLIFFTVFVTCLQQYIPNIYNVLRNKTLNKGLEIK